MARLLFTLTTAALFSTSLPLAAQDSPAQGQDIASTAPTSGEQSAPREQTIVVTGDGANDDDEKLNEKVRRIGRQITRAQRSGKPAARIDDALCVRVSGMPEEYGAIIRARIEENASQLRGFRVNQRADCMPNAFLGFLNNVTDAVKQLEVDEPWLFEGLKGFELERIYAGSKDVRAWHRFDRRNLDGSTLPGDRQVGEGAEQFVNQTQVATRLNKDRLDIIGAVVLIETGAIREKTLRQIADYATVRLLASVSDDVKSDPNTPETVLTLFNEEFAPASITDFDMAYLEALYELPANSRDGTVIAAAVKRYNDRQRAKPSG